MAISKKSEFNRKDQETSDFAKTLSHPARIAILKMLAGKGTCVCGEIVNVLPLAQSTVSQHLKELKSAGLIRGEVEGPTSCYCIDWKAMERGWRALQTMMQDLESASRKCC